MAWFTGQLLWLLGAAFVGGLFAGWLWWSHESDAVDADGDGEVEGREGQGSRAVRRSDLRSSLRSATAEVERLRKAVAVRDEAMAEQRASSVDTTRLQAELAARDRRLADLEASSEARSDGDDEELEQVLLERLRQRNDRVRMLEQQAAERAAVTRARIAELEVALEDRDERVAEQAARLRDLDERLAEPAERGEDRRARTSEPDDDVIVLGEAEHARQGT